MSRKAKMFRAWEHNYPDEDAKSAFSFAWNYRKNEVSTLTAEVERLKGENRPRISTLTLQRWLEWLGNPNYEEFIRKDMRAALQEQQ